MKWMLLVLGIFALICCSYQQKGKPRLNQAICKDIIQKFQQMKMGMNGTEFATGENRTDPEQKPEPKPDPKPEPEPNGADEIANKYINSGRLPTVCFALVNMKDLNIEMNQNDMQDIIRGMGRNIKAVTHFADTALSDVQLLSIIQMFIQDMTTPREVIGALTNAYIRKTGGPQSVTPETIVKIRGAVLLIPGIIFSRLPKSTVDYILDKIAEEKQKMMEARNVVDPELQHNMTMSIDHTFTLGFVPRDWTFKVLCKSIFAHYRNIKTGDLNRVGTFMHCAPKDVCASFTSDAVQQNIHLFTENMWTCGNPGKGQYREAFEYMKRASPNNQACGRILAKKAVSGGANPINITVDKGPDELGPLTICLDVPTLIQIVSSISCNSVSQAIQTGFLPSPVEKVAVSRCLKRPENPSAMTCDDILATGGYISYLSRDFLKKIPKSAYCDNRCFAMVTRTVKTSYKKYITKLCYEDVTLNIEKVREMGSSVMQLPLSKFKEIQGSDLMEVATELKETVAQQKKKDPRTKMILRMVAKKVRQAGGLKQLADNKEVMKQISVKDLASSVTNVLQDLGLNENVKPNLADAQNKFLIKKIFETQKPEDMTEEDIREKSTLVKGMLARHIAKLNRDEGMGIAVALCEQKDWPTKSRRAINSMLKESLGTLNETFPMSTLTATDVQNLGCECVLDFKSEDIAATSTETCKELCSSIGTCPMTQCVNRYHRRQILETCLRCIGKDSDNAQLTGEDVDTLGYNLVSEMTDGEFKKKLSDNVFQEKITMFKGSCLRKGMRAEFGARLSKLSPDSLDMEKLGKLLTYLPDAEREQLDKSKLAEVVKPILNELGEDQTDEEKKVGKCCERWLGSEDVSEMKSNLKNFYKILISALRTSLSRKKRATVQWKCTDIQTLGEAFNGVPVEELTAIPASEFETCLGNLGDLTWTKEQRDALLSKVESEIGKPCELAADDYLRLGTIAVSLSTSQISCLPLSDDDFVAGLGTLSSWSTEQSY